MHRRERFSMNQFEILNTIRPIIAFGLIARIYHLAILEQHFWDDVNRNANKRILEFSAMAKQKISRDSLYVCEKSEISRITIQFWVVHSNVGGEEYL